MPSQNNDKETAFIAMLTCIAALSICIIMPIQCCIHIISRPLIQPGDTVELYDDAGNKTEFTNAPGIQYATVENINNDEIQICWRTTTNYGHAIVTIDKLRPIKVKRTTIDNIDQLTSQQLQTKLKGAGFTLMQQIGYHNQEFTQPPESIYETYNVFAHRPKNTD